MDFVKTNGLSKKFNKFAVKDASISLQPGKIYGLLGPNGSGKSTLMKMVAGLFHPTKGKIEIMGEPISYKSREFVSFMPTENYFYNYMDIKTVGKYHSDFYKDFDAVEFNSLIEHMQLEPKMKVESLSSGMAAKLKLATAMARNAKVYMLDEPLNGIDLIARDLVLSSIIKKSSEDNVMLISSHLIDAMESILDEVIFLKDGEIVLSGEAEGIRETHNKSIVDLYKEVFA